MKKIILFALLLLFIPLITSASLDTNLYYGLRNNDDVRELQGFLINKGLLNVPATGNFLSLTLSAVKSYQASAGIIQTGYVGILTRTAINSEMIESSSVTPPATTNDTITALQAQIALLLQQVRAMQAQQTTPPVTQKVKGCVDSTAVNYNSSAEESDGSCVFSSVTLETDRTYFIKTTGEDFILQTLVYEIKPSPYYYNKSYAYPTELDYIINGGDLIFLTGYLANSCVQHLSVAGCSDSSYQYYVEPNIIIPKDSALNIVDLPNKIATGAFYLTSVILKGVTTGKIVTLRSLN